MNIWRYGTPPGDGNGCWRPSGNIILQSTHTMLWDVPLKNIIAYVEKVRALAGLDTPRPAQTATQ